MRLGSFQVTGECPTFNRRANPREIGLKGRGVLQLGRDPCRWYPETAHLIHWIQEEVGVIKQ